MPCNHKFAEYLELRKITFVPHTLIVGTFNPSWPESNTAEWFYGRTRNNYFWEVLPKLYNERSLKNADPSEWKSFCTQHGIAITDLISCIVDADEFNPNHRTILNSYKDKEIIKTFHCYKYVDIISLLTQHSINSIFLTRKADGDFWEKLWIPIKEYCKTKGIIYDTLLTPSGSARFHITNKAMSLSDNILMEWRKKWQ